MRKCIDCQADFSPNNGSRSRRRRCDKCQKLFKRTQKSACSAVSYAVLMGKLPRPDSMQCVDCGSRAAHFEHRDYSKPLEVEPVCQPCNRRRGPAYWKGARWKPTKRAAKPDAPECAAFTLMGSQAHNRPLSAVSSNPATTSVSGDTSKTVGLSLKRTYRYVGLDWSDPDAVRAFNREAQRRWRAANCKAKRA